MSQYLRVLLSACAAVAMSLPITCDAYVHHVQFPLTGFRTAATAKGMVNFYERTGETDAKDGSTLIVEVSNVPLPPGTELSVLVQEKEVGIIKLDKNRGGRLVLETNYKSSVPRVTPGSFVVVKVPLGSIVVW